jgi:hypothetical protein
VADRLELALYCLNHRVLEGNVSLKPAAPSSAQPTNGHAAAEPARSNAAAAASGSRS